MTTQELLDQRYGRRHTARRRRTAWAVVAITAVLAVAALAWLTWMNASRSVAADATSFEVVDEHRVAVTFQVSAPVGSAVACALEAQDAQHGVVGWRVVEYPASDAAVRAFTEAVPTVATATTGFVNACWVI